MTHKLLRLTEREDQSERAMHTAIDAVSDFQKAIVDAKLPSRCQQIAERCRVASVMFADARDAAIKKSQEL